MGLRRRWRRRRNEAGRRSGQEAGEAPSAGGARGRRRRAGAGARAGLRSGYDDPAAGPRISSPHGSPNSRLRTRYTGGMASQLQVFSPHQCRRVPSAVQRN